MTRVATTTAYRQALQDLQRNQAEIARLQAGVGSGQRILKPSDDPAGASRVPSGKISATSASPRAWTVQLPVSD